MDIISNNDIEKAGKKRSLLKSFKKIRTAFAFVLWLLAMTLLVALFVMKKDQLKHNLEQAQVKERLFGKNESLPIKTEEEAAPIFANPKELQQESTEESSQEAIESEQEQQEAEEQSVEMTNASLYFALIDENGNVELALITRAIPKTDSPMMSALNAVISGVTPEEAESGLQSLVPLDSELLGATVNDGIATLNFNEAFEYNNFAFQGSFYQLMQIVYTATEFPTVDSVQILINGEKREYLGSEGLFIGSPLSRDSFVAQ